MNEQLPAQPPTHDEYRQAVDSKQSRIDTALKELQADIDLINLELETLAADKSKHDQIPPLAESAVAYLNKKSELTGSILTVSGHWYEPTMSALVDREGTTFRAKQVHREVLTTAPCAGFTVGQVPGEDGTYVPPQILTAFQLPPVHTSTPAGYIDMTPVALADIREVTLTFVRENTNEIVSGNIDEIVTLMDETNAMLLEFINDESLGFYDLNLEDQQDFFNNLLDDVHSKLPDSRAEDYLLIDSAMASELFISETTSGHGTLEKLTTQDHQPLPLTGVVVGFCIPDEITNKGAVHYTSRSELTITQRGGLGIIVKPSPGSVDYLPEAYRHQDIVVPYDNLEDIEIRLI